MTMTVDVTTPNELSLEALWMPFTANRAFKRSPRMLVEAKGMYYTSADGRQILDATAGLWCVNAGHCREPIVQAIQRAAATLDYAPAFSMGHPLSFELATRLADMLPGDLDHVFFANSGSEAVDTALKIALAYHISRGKPRKARFIGRVRGYHGVGFGGISVGGIENNRKAFAAQLLPQVDHLPTTHDLTRNAFSRGMPSAGKELADALDLLVAQYGADSIAAVIVEPVAGSAGVLVPPVGYLERLRELCTRHDILLIFDEVITGFGRLGATFGAEQFGVQPDMMTLAKGITNGAVPMGAVCVRRGIYESVVNAVEGGIEFFHGYTYSGHPLAAAAGLATLDVYRDEGLFGRAAELAPYWEEAVHSLRGLPHVIDIRNMGLVGAVELQPRDGKPASRGMDAMVDAFMNENLLVRVTGDIIALSPPLIIEREQIDAVVERLGRTLRRLA
ncbi:MAG TPA: aspartate aminotransferase family protein [Gemmatimonadaceae bacterium]|nr:aspartate aminotransferase family protein [Gemmatimonadaceae bacterium]